MRRSGPCRAFREVFRQSWLIALTVAVGCAHLDSNLSDRLARRALPVEVEAERETSPPQENAHVRGTSDANVKPAVAVPPVQGSGAGTPNDRSSALPPALVGPPRRQDSDRAHPTAISLPNDSDDATLDAISTNGKPVSLPGGDQAGIPASTSAESPAREHFPSTWARADRVLDLPAHRRRQL